MKFLRYAALSIGASQLVRAQRQPSTPTNSTSIQIINIGRNGQSTLSPDFISLNNEDTMVFKFSSGMHSITQSSFAAPCVPLAGGFSTGPVYVSPNSTQPEVRAYTIPLKSEQALWFFSGEAGDCQAGMVLGVNVANNQNHTEIYKKFEEYKANAKKAPLTSNDLSFISNYHAETVVAFNFSNGTLAPELANIKAEVGDLVAFVAQGANYTVTQSSLETPCTPLPGGFLGVSAPANAGALGMAPLFFRIRTDKPIYGIYGQQGQCSGGIPFAINANEQQFQAFKQRVETGGQPQQPSTQVATNAAETRPAATSPTGSQSEPTGTTGSDSTTGPDPTTEDTVKGQESTEQQRRSAKWVMRRQLMRWG